MSAAKKPLVILIVLGLTAWVVFTSWKPQIESYSINGKVKALYGTVANAKLKYTQDKDELDIDNMKEIDVTANGTFSSVINIKPHGPVYFYVVKDGYTTIRHKQILSNPNGNNRINEMKISSLHEGLSIKQKLNKKLAPKIGLYRDGCLAELDDKVSIHDIMYFENLQSLSESECSLKPGEARLSANINISGERASTFFKLKRLNGRMVITSPPPVNKATYTSFQ